MTIYWQGDGITLHHGNCVSIMADMPEHSVDAIVCDPPYGLEFMGKDWDKFGVGKQPKIGEPDGSKFRQNMGTPSFTDNGNPTCRNCGGDKYRNGPRKCSCTAPNFGNPQAESMRGFQRWSEQWAREALRVLKPGGHLLAFGGTRTAHRLAVAVEDAGFEIRDSIAWHHQRHVFCQCSPVPYNHATVSREGVPGLRKDLATDDALSSSSEPDVLKGVREHAYGDSELGGQAAATEARRSGVRELREAFPDSPESASPSGEPDLLASVQRSVARTGVGEARIEGPRCLDGRESGVLQAEDVRREQSGVAGGRHLLAQEGELPTDQVRPGPGVGAADVPEGRVHHGTSTDHGPLDRTPSEPTGGCAPSRPQPPEQQPGEPGALAVEWIPQGGGAWPGCPRCRKPLAPPFDGGHLTWNFGSGFPKSLDVSKAIDKAAGAEREVTGSNPNHRAVSGVGYEGIYAGGNTGGAIVTAPATDAARKWQGWGTALKPAHEPIVVARKPLDGTVAANVLAHGTGALNIDATRIGTEVRVNPAAGNKPGGAALNMSAVGMPQGVAGKEAVGRWPANVVLDEVHEQVLRLRYNLPVEAERTIREFFNASTDHLPRLRDSTDGATEQTEPNAFLLPEVLRPVDEPQPDRRERDPLATGTHGGVAPEDAGRAGGEGAARISESSVDGRDLPQPGIHPRSGASVDFCRTGDLLLDAQRIDGSGVHTGAPSGRSQISGATVEVNGACPSPERSEGRQSPGEPGTPLERGPQTGTHRGGARGLSAASGERNTPGSALEVLRCDVPPPWLSYFEDTGRTVRGGQAAALDQQSGVLKSGERQAGRYRGLGYHGSESAEFPAVNSNQGGASRFFYVAKAPKNQRPVVDGVAHPTVKPLDLMRWLVRLVTPPGGVVLDPFAGSGTTIEAAILEGFDVIGVEQDATYLPLIQERIRRCQQQPADPDEPTLFGDAS